MLALNFDLAEHLPAPRPFSERWHLMLIALAASFSILYLAHYKGTRLLRLAIWPAGPAALSWFILTVDLKYSTYSMGSCRYRVREPGRRVKLIEQRLSTGLRYVRPGLAASTDGERELMHRSWVQCSMRYVTPVFRVYAAEGVVTQSAIEVIEVQS